MTNTDQTAIADAKSAYDRACGAVSGSDWTGFLLAMVIGFWTSEHFATSHASPFVIQLVCAVIVLAVVRTYYSRNRRSAEDAYHRIAKLGKYAPIGKQ
jgi:hypothetical protein